MHCQLEENPQNVSVSLNWDFVTLPEKYRATAIGNMHKHLVKIARSSGDILADSQTNTHTDTHTLSLQYFVTLRERINQSKAKLKLSELANLAYRVDIHNETTRTLKMIGVEHGSILLSSVS